MTFADESATWTSAGALGLAALADAQEEGSRVALLGEVGSTLDLDAALRRALEAVSELTGADAATIVLRQEEGEPITAAFGLSDEECSRELIGLPPDGGRTRAVRLSYLYTAEEAANDEFRLSGGLGVPLPGESEERIGTLAIFWRRVERTLSDSELEQFEELSRAFGPTLENARLFSEARRLADNDHLTGLHNARYFEERLRREIARARRYERRLGLLVFDLEQGGGADLAAAGERIRAAVRATDIASHLGEGRFAIILPEAAEADAERLHRRVQFALGGRVDSGAEGVRIHAGLVELRAGDDASIFRERAVAALQRAKRTAANRLSAAQ